MQKGTRMRGNTHKGECTREHAQWNMQKETHKRVNAHVHMFLLTCTRKHAQGNTHVQEYPQGGTHKGTCRMEHTQGNMHKEIHKREYT